MPQGNSGYLIVGGIDKELNGQVWSYNTQIESWATLSIPDSGDVGVVAVDNSNNHLYVAGSTGRGTSWLWSYF